MTTAELDNTLMELNMVKDRISTCTDFESLENELHTLRGEVKSTKIVDLLIVIVDSFAGKLGAVEC